MALAKCASRTNTLVSVSHALADVVLMVMRLAPMGFSRWGNTRRPFEPYRSMSSPPLLSAACPLCTARTPLHT